MSVERYADHATADETGFEERVSSYAQKLTILLRENPVGVLEREVVDVRALGAP
jgi:hypothetical protein